MEISPTHSTLTHSTPGPLWSATLPLCILPAVDFLLFMYPTLPPVLRWRYKLQSNIWFMILIAVFAIYSGSLTDGGDSSSSSSLRLSRLWGARSPSSPCRLWRVPLIGDHNGSARPHLYLSVACPRSGRNEETLT